MSDIDNVLIKLFMAGRKSMRDEIDSKGRLVQKPIQDQIKEAKDLIENRVKVCPCGYVKECPVHCGDGHENGQCPPWDNVEEIAKEAGFDNSDEALMSAFKEVEEKTYHSLEGDLWHILITKEQPTGNIRALDLSAEHSRQVAALKQYVDQLLEKGEIDTLGRIIPNFDGIGGVGYQYDDGSRVSIDTRLTQIESSLEEKKQGA